MTDRHQAKIPDNRLRYLADKQYSLALELWQKMLPSLLFIWSEPYTPSVVRTAQLRATEQAMYVGRSRSSINIKTPGFETH